MRIGDLPLELVEVMQGPQPRWEFECDGCTCSPDRIGGRDLRPACLYHDYAYRLGGTEADRRLADDRFYRNLRACGLGHFLASVYFRRVRLFGMRHFDYRPATAKPRGLWARLVILASRYVEF